MRTLILTAGFILAACAPVNETITPSPVVTDNTNTVSVEYCGTRGTATCSDKNDFCNWKLTDQCGAFDKPGICSPRPEMCTMQYEPVCGCDGKTYGNACSANSQGVSVKSNGECPTI